MISLTQVKIGSQTSNLSCLASDTDIYPCYEIFNGNNGFDYVDLVCNSQHFSRFILDKTGSKGDIILKEGDDQKTISAFVNPLKEVVATFPDKDREQFWYFVSFISIGHAYGAATSIRVLIEDFIKDNYLFPSLYQELAKEDLKSLEDKANKKGNNLLAQAAIEASINSIFNALINGTNDKGGLGKKIIGSVIKFSKSERGRKWALKSAQWSEFKSVFDTSSQIIHGKQYDSTQLFNQAKAVLKLLKDLYDLGQRWNK